MDPIKHEDGSVSVRVSFPPYKRDPSHDHQTMLIGLLEHIDEAVSILADAKIKEHVSADQLAKRGRDRARQGSR